MQPGTTLQQLLGCALRSPDSLVLTEKDGNPRGSTRAGAARHAASVFLEEE